MGDFVDRCQGNERSIEHCGQRVKVYAFAFDPEQGSQ